MRLTRVLVGAGLALSMAVAVAPQSVAGGTDPATTMTAVRSPANQLYQFNVGVVAALNNTETGDPLLNQPVRLERRLRGAQTWVALETKATVAQDNPDTPIQEVPGSATFRTKAVANADYRVVYDGAAGVGMASVSRLLPVGVFRNLGARDAQPIGDSRRFAFFGRVSPTWAEKAIVLQKKTCFTPTCKWQFVAKKKTSANSDWRFEVLARASKGIIKYRTVVPETTLYRKSPSAVLTLRTR